MKGTRVRGRPLRTWTIGLLCFLLVAAVGLLPRHGEEPRLVGRGATAEAQLSGQVRVEADVLLEATGWLEPGPVRAIVSVTVENASEQPVSPDFTLRLREPADAGGSEVPPGAVNARTRATTTLPGRTTVFHTAYYLGADRPESVGLELLHDGEDFPGPDAAAELRIPLEWY